MLYGEDTEVFYSCSISWRNQFFVFGGFSPSLKRQISKLVGCKLSRVGTLDFDHSYGGCASLADNQVFLCFDYIRSEDYRKCRVASDPLGDFTVVSRSSFDHRYTRVASSDSKFYCKTLNQFFSRITCRRKLEPK